MTAVEVLTTNEDVAIAVAGQDHTPEPTTWNGLVRLEIDRLLIEDPPRSNASIADEVGCIARTVAKRRSALGLPAEERAPKVAGPAPSETSWALAGPWGRICWVDRDGPRLEGDPGIQARIRATAVELARRGERLDGRPVDLGDGAAAFGVVVLVLDALGLDCGALVVS